MSTAALTRLPTNIEAPSLVMTGYTHRLMLTTRTQRQREVETDLQKPDRRRAANALYAYK